MSGNLYKTENYRGPFHFSGQLFTPLRCNYTIRKHNNKTNSIQNEQLRRCSPCLGA